MKLDNLTVYSKIYDVVKENQETAGQTLMFQKNTFCACCEREPKLADMSESQKLDDDEFLCLAYEICLNRLVDERAKQIWSKKIKSASKKAREEIMFSISTSAEFMQLGKIIINNPYKTCVMKQKIVFVKLWNRIASSVVRVLKTNKKLRGIWHNIPSNIRERIIFILYK